MISWSSRRRMLVGHVAVVLLVAASATSGAAVAQADSVVASAHSAAVPPQRPRVRLPHDEAPHHAPTEWWYFSGHLRAVDAAGHQHDYGFEYVTFQFLGPASDPVYVANLSVTDLARHRFVYAAKTDSYPIPATTDSFRLHTGSWQMKGAGDSDTLRAALPGYALHLRLRTSMPATLHGRHGEIPFGPFGTSAYYSFTSLATGGVIIDHGVRLRVSGTSWMDHQWGAFDFATGGGWDWFSVQLNDGSRYMLYFIRDADGNIVDTVGTRVDPGRHVSHLPAGSFTERAISDWRSPVTGIDYSSRWTLRVPGGTLHVRPLLRDQELDLRQVQGVAYWEGDVSVRGRVNGRPVRGDGYTEINPAGQP